MCLLEVVTALFFLGDDFRFPGDTGTCACFLRLFLVFVCALALFVFVFFCFSKTYVFVFFWSFLDFFARFVIVSCFAGICLYFLCFWLVFHCFGLCSSLFPNPPLPPEKSMQDPCKWKWWNTNPHSVPKAVQVTTQPHRKSRYIGSSTLTVEISNVKLLYFLNVKTFGHKLSN